MKIPQPPDLHAIGQTAPCRLDLEAPTAIHCCGNHFCRITLSLTPTGGTNTSRAMRDAGSDGVIGTIIISMGKLFIINKSIFMNHNVMLRLRSVKLHQILTDLRCQILENTLPAGLTRNWANCIMSTGFGGAYSYSPLLKSSLLFRIESGTNRRD